MVKTLIICLLNRNYFFTTFEKVRPGAERKLRNILTAQENTKRYLNKIENLCEIVILIYLD